jgi:hypothetical protein
MTPMVVIDAGLGLAYESKLQCIEWGIIAIVGF